jgi:uncharacterized protein YeaO (DUF488 family)
VKKEMAALDEWLRELAPSTPLRKWFGHDPGRWSEFQKRYRAELRQCKPQLGALRQRAARRPLTLLYGAKDPRFNQAVVIQKVLQGPAAPKS